MQTKFSNLKITAVSSALPKQVFNLYELGNKFGNREVSKIIEGTGIKSIRVASDSMKGSDICHAAVDLLLKTIQIDPKTIDAIIYITQTPDRVAPPTSVLLQDRLGLTKDVVAFDINYGCSGYIYGLYQAALLLNSGGCKRILVCAGDVISKFIHEDDKNLRMLLGDAGTATLVEKGEDTWEVEIHTDGSGSECLTAEALHPCSKEANIFNKKRGYYYMDGLRVMNFVLGPAISDLINEIQTLKKWRKNEYTLFLHQANLFMLDVLRKKIGINSEHVPVDIDSVGNTGPASIPLLLSMTGNELKIQNKLEKSLLCGFGVGLSWGAIGLNLDQTCFLTPIEI